MRANGGHRPRAAATAGALGLGAAATAMLHPAWAAEIPEPADHAAPTEVVVTAPLPGADLFLSEVPANVQRVSASDFDRGRTLNAADALNQLVGSVNINDTQGNPFQPDLEFRGFTASPVLGTAQGVSVFVDGVRVNEAFGDAVNWELIPQAAISSLEVTPGANPVFGLNTLGGAVVVATRRGFDFPGTSAELEGGSFGRRNAQLASGGHGERLDWLVSGTVYDDDGWAEHNGNRVRQAFAKAGYRDGQLDLTLSGTYAGSRLEGNQSLPRSFLADPRQSYTWPDVQRDELGLFNLTASQRRGPAWTVTGQAYYRAVRTTILNSNVNSAFDPALAPGPGNQPTGNIGERLEQRRPGLAFQLVGRTVVGGHRNTLIVGLAYDRGATEFSQSTQQAGSARDTSSSAPFVLGTALHATNRAAGAYFTDTLNLRDKVFLNFAGRFNDARVTLADRIGTALDGRDDYRRLNPAIGITASPSDRLTAFARYEEGTRAPTPVELTCADPEAPCSLPNAFASDPPLKAVVARSFEIGGRGAPAPWLGWSASLFQTRLQDDIQFVSSGGGTTSTGYFRNVALTRRRGVEMAAQAQSGGLKTSAHYTWLQATFETPLVLASPSSSAAAPISCPACAEIRVVPGDRIPGIPRHIVKLRAEYERGPAGIGLTLTAESDRYARGDESNQDRNGPLPGFALVNLDAHCGVGGRLSVFARIDNLLDRRNFSFATLGRNVFTAPGDTFDASGASWRAEQFRTIGVPRGAWLGLQYRLGPNPEGTRR